MIAALARGAWVLDDPEYSKAAVKAARFLLNHLWEPNTQSTQDDRRFTGAVPEATKEGDQDVYPPRAGRGRLLARYRDGQAAFPAYLDDYAFLVWGLIELYGATFDPAWLEQALSLNRQMVEMFRDEQGGGFFFTGNDAEPLPARPKEIYDGALPSGNAVVALNLLRLARLTGDDDLESQAAAQLGAFAGTVSGYPAGYTFYLCALDFALGAPLEITVAGERGAADAEALLQVLRDVYLPGASVLFKPSGEEAEKGPVDGRAAAYVCRNYTCLAPVTDPMVLGRNLNGGM